MSGELPLQVLACLVGLALLARSADWLVLGCSALAELAGVPAVVVGVVVIGFGTSAPELLVSGLAAAAGSAGIGIGNVIGSNIANLTLVLGAAALVAPVGVHVRLVRREVPLALAASAAFAVAVQGGLSRSEGFLLIAGLAVSLSLLLWWAMAGRGRDGDLVLLRQETDELLQAGARTMRGSLWQAGSGLLGTLVGAQTLVWGAVGLAGGLGLSEGFVGVTIVAVGTSLPELVTAAQASRRGESDLLVGNLLGSNVFNALGVGGLIGLLAPRAAVARSLTVTGVVIMIGVAVLALAFMARGFRVVRWEAAVLVAVFVGSLPLLAAG